MGQIHHGFEGVEEELLPTELSNLGVAPLCVAPGQTPFAHSHDLVEEVLIVKSGQGQIEIERECHEVCAGSVAVIGAGEFHALTNTGDENLEAMVVFNSNVDLESLVLRSREEHFGTGALGAEERRVLAELRDSVGSINGLLQEVREEVAALRSVPRKRRVAAKVS